MAWLFKRGQTWWIGWRINGQQFLKSTKKKDEEGAGKVLKDYQAIEAAANAGRLTNAFVDSFTVGTSTTISFHKALDLWLEEAKGIVTAGTLANYEAKTRALSEFLNATEHTPLLRDITTDDLIRFVQKKRSEIRAKTVNDTIIVIKGFFKRCVDLGRIQKSPADQLKYYKIPREEKSSRRALTLEEVTKIYNACPNDFWRFMVLGGFYTGLRLGDLICMAWENVDWKANCLRIIPRKTPDKTLHIPMASPFRNQLQVIAKTSTRTIGLLWPKEAAKYESRKGLTFSKAFTRQVLTRADIVSRKEYNKSKNGEKKRMDWISFHYLRHTFVSVLKVSGASQSVAKELAGHSSDEISDLYTTVPVDVLEKAVNQLPTIT